jgi:hypothetical protein
VRQLRQRRCGSARRDGQGYLLGRPVPAGELAAILRTLDVGAVEAAALRLTQPR